jgi:hypothetical protein
MDLINRAKEKLVDAVVGVPENTTMEVIPVGSFHQAIEFTISELLDDEYVNIVFLDIDRTLSSGQKARWARYPGLVYLTDWIYSGQKYFPEENMRDARVLNDAVGGNVAVATQRQEEFFFPWRSRKMLNELRAELAAQGLGKMEIFQDMNRMIQNKWVQFSRREHERLIDWVLSRRDPDKNRLKLMMIADYDLRGAAWSEKPFLKNAAMKLRRKGVDEKIELVHVKIEKTRQKKKK